MLINNCWLIGTGYMAQAYAKVLNDLNIEYTVIGRGEKNAALFEKEIGTKPITGGLSNFLIKKPTKPQNVIVAVGIEALSSVTTELLEYGIQKILLEKPGVGYPSEIIPLLQKAKETNAQVFLAYNRRFYASVLAAQKMIAEDGGIKSFNFEFTEWSHRIKDLDKTKAEWENWFLGNSTHIVDTAFFLGGKPTQIATFHNGANILEWHPKSSNYAGAGLSDKNALFAYHANWTGPGRWSMEFLTSKRRFIFRPIEKLQVQLLGSVRINPVEIDDDLDIRYKPGVYLQTKAFLEEDYTNLCDLTEQATMIADFYIPMSGY